MTPGEAAVMKTSVRLRAVDRRRRLAMSCATAVAVLPVDRARCSRRADRRAPLGTRGRLGEVGQSAPLGDPALAAEAGEPLVT